MGNVPRNQICCSSFCFKTRSGGLKEWKWNSKILCHQRTEQDQGAKAIEMAAMATRTDFSQSC